MRGMEKAEKSGSMLTDTEINVYRTLYLINGMIASIMVCLWYRFHSEQKINSFVILCLSIYYMGIYFLSKDNKYIRQRLHRLLYGSYYFVSMFLAYLGYINHFSVGYTLLFMLVVFFYILTFSRLSYLLCYLIYILPVFFGALYAVQLKEQNIHGIMIGAGFTIFSFIAAFNVYLRIRFERNLKESYEDYQRLLDSSPDAIIVQEDMKIVYANPVIVKALGKKSQDEIIGMSIMDIIHYSERKEIESDIEELLKNREKGFHERKILLSNNKELELEIGTTVTTYRGRQVVMITLKDISKRKAMQRQLAEAEYKYRSLVEASLTGVYIYQNGKVIYVNPYIEEVSGYSSEEIYNMDFLNLIYHEDRALVMNALEKLRFGAKKAFVEVRGVKKDGRIYYVQLQGTSAIYNGEPALIGTLIDITERKETENKISYMAYHDSLTGLPTRYLLKEYLGKSLEKCRPDGLHIGVMFIDLDRFKTVNDTMGHNFGDILLQQAAKRLSRSIRQGDFVARYGGDEFVLVLKDISLDEIHHVAKRILKVFSEPFHVDSNDIYISPSIGISTAPSDSEDTDTLIKFADTAMYLAKEQGRNTYRFYSKELESNVSEKIRLENGLRRALGNGEFELYYQPQVEFNSGRIYGAEALIRWQHPELGLISPSDFIPLAEETGLIRPIGEWALENACRQNKLWQDSGLSPIQVSVNVSRIQLQDESFRDTISRILYETRLDPEYLELEIRESIMQDTMEMARMLEDIRAMGVKIAVDHFGVGNSSLCALQHMTVDSLKFDQAFLKYLGENVKTAAIVKTIVDMGRILNLRVIAEGIENEQQLEHLKNARCELGQGYLFSKPVPVEGLESLLRLSQGTVP